MKHISSAVVVLVAVSASFAQTKVPEGDLKKLAETLGAYLDPAVKTDYKKLEAAKKAFSTEFDRVEKSLKPASLLGMADAWSEVYAVKRKLAPVPSGLGRPAEKKLSEDQSSGKTATFSWGLLLPNGYDPKKRYPLIIALHDKSVSRDREVTGTKYLEEVWMKLPKEERDQFVIVAPTLGPSALGKDFRVEWGDVLQLKMVAIPLQDMIENYAIDFDRVYLEGTGEGGEFAMHLALTKPHLFAAVAVRSTVPKFPQVLANGGSLPLAAHFRAGSPAQTSPVKGTMEQQVKTLGLPCTIKEHPAPDKPVKTSFASDVIPEATSEIAAFLAGKKRDLAPKKLYFITEKAAQCYWLRLGKFVSDQGFTTSVKAQVDATTNTIAIDTENVETLRLLLNDRVIDLAQPVKVTVNGKPHTERQITPSIDVLLKYFEDNILDPSLQPTAIVEIKVADAAESAPPTPK